MSRLIAATATLSIALASTTAVAAEVVCSNPIGKSFFSKDGWQDDGFKNTTVTIKQLPSADTWDIIMTGDTKFSAVEDGGKVITMPRQSNSILFVVV